MARRSAPTPPTRRPRATSRSPRRSSPRPAGLTPPRTTSTGPARGDELPDGLTTREGRRAWLREAKERLEREREEQAEPVPNDRSQRLAVCQRRLVEDWRRERFASRDSEAHFERGVLERGRKAMGSGP